MANFDIHGITQAGLNLMGKAVGGATIQFTRLVMGDGKMTGEVLDMQGVVSQRQNVDITRIERNGAQCSVGGEILTKNVKQGFFWRECGLYAIDPDVGEILYNYAYSTKPDYIAASDSGMMEEIMVSMIATVGSNTNVNVTIDESMVFTTKKEFQKIKNIVDGMFVNVQDYGAIGDGKNHKLSDKYATLELAKLDFPNALSLDDEIDTCAIELAITTTEPYQKRMILIPNGIYMVNREIAINRDYVFMRCEGIIKNIGEGFAFAIDGANYGTYEGFYFLYGNGCFVIRNGSLQNKFLHTTLQGVKKYAFEIDNTIKSPAYTQIIGVTCIYIGGLLKNIATSSKYGHEFTLSDIHFTSSGIIDSNDIPAFIWCRHIHDIFINDIMGICHSGIFLFEGDCLGQIDMFNVTSIKKNSVIITPYDNRRPDKFMFTNFLIWGANENNPEYVDVAAFELTGCISIHVTNGRIGNIDKGIIQGSNGKYFYENMTLYDCNNFICFENYNINEVALHTNAWIVNCHFLGQSKKRNLLFSRLPLGYKQGTSIQFNNCDFANVSTYDFNPADQFKELKFIDCKFTSQLTDINDMYCFINNIYSDTIPISGIYKKGYKILKQNVNAGQYSEFICIASGGRSKDEWKSTTTYALGDWIDSGGLIFKCIKAGTSGTLRPTSGVLGSIIDDGTCQWLYKSTSSAVFKGLNMIES